MEAGKLKHPITVCTQTLASDGQGGVSTVTYTKVFDTRAAVRTMRTRDIPTSADITMYEELLDFTVRYRPGYDSKQWIQFRGRNYEIIGIDNKDLLNREMVIRAGARKPEKRS